MILKLFRKCNNFSKRTTTTTITGINQWRNIVTALSSLSPSARVIDSGQLKSSSEKCYLVDENDKIIGTETKEKCHQIQPDGTLPLHRAFSIFLFNQFGHLLLQQRSETKVTYPGYYSNTCCSHPLADYVGEDENGDTCIGVKRAAQRRLNYELGIPRDEIPLDEFVYVTRLHYFDNENGVTGEHEIDYILFFITRNGQNITIKPNRNEVSKTEYVTRQQLQKQYEDNTIMLTPWFKYLLKEDNFLLWWENLHNITEYIDTKNIHKV